MSFWGWITGGSKQVDKVTDAIINTGDALVYTEEEKEQDRAKRRELWFKFMELARDESSIKSVTRRIIALAVMFHWLVFLDVALALYLMDKDEKAKAVFALATDMLWIVGGVGAFYFGTHLLRQAKK